MNITYGHLLISLPFIFIIIFIITINIPSFSHPIKINDSLKYDKEVLLKQLNVIIDNEEGIKQLHYLIEKNKVLSKLLSMKFNKNEVTYIQYKDIINEIYFAVLKNLEKHCCLEKTIKPVDINYLSNKIQHEFWHNKQEKESTLQRFELSKKIKDKANKLLIENEKAFNTFDSLIFELISFNNEGNRNIDKAIKNLLKISKKFRTVN